MAKDRHAPKNCDFDGEQPEATEFDSVIESIYKKLNEQLTQLFAAMVKSATGKMVVLESQPYSYESPEKSKRQSRERESIRYLLNNSNNISSKFFINITEQLKPDLSNSDAPLENELSLVSHEEMEEMVAITIMHTNALNHFGETISNLNTHVEYLEIKNAPIFNSKAISPKGVSEAYRKTLNQLNMGTDVNLELFKLFDEEVIQKSESMYGSLNQIFIDSDIMPEIIHTSDDLEVPEEKSTFSTQTAGDSDVQKNMHTNFIPQSQAELNHIVSQFTRGNISVPGDELKLPASFHKDPAVQNIDGKKYYQRKDIVRSLNRLQKKILEQGKNSELNTAEEIKRSFMDDIGGTGNDGIAKEISILDGGTGNDGIAKEVSILDERNIDFVGMMFNAITDDDSISDVVTDLVTQLHIPVIKVALNDEQLFQDKEHPTRKVLNLITKAGKGITDTEDKLYNKIAHVVKNILAEHDVDIDSFYKAVDALHKIIHIEEKTSANNEKEVQKSIIKEHARTVVIAEIRKHSIGRYIPKDVQPLILKHWSTLMLNRYISHGNESVLWTQSSMLCKLIIDILQPVKHKFQLEQLTSQYNALLEVVSDELYETQQDKASIDIQLSTLKNTFEKMIDKHAHLMIDEENIPRAEIDYAVQKEMAEYDATMAQIKEEECVVDKVARLPTYVKPGVWFEIYNGEDHPIRRLKMSVILIETGNIVFVDRKGIKGIEKDAGEFADELNNNKSRIIADHSTFDHALGNVITIMA